MKKLKKVLLAGVFSVMIGGILTGCNVDYTGSFAIKDVTAEITETENKISVNYEFTNPGKGDGVTFHVMVDDEQNTHTAGKDEKVSSGIVLDIGKPENYNLEYPVKFEVMKDGKTLWSTEEIVSYDCADLFHHEATIRYGSEEKVVELTDYESNFFNLEEMFSSFDGDKVHNVKILEKGDHDRVYLRPDENGSVKGTDGIPGAILHAFTYGKEEICDTYRYSDGLVFEITDAVSAKDVNWEEHITFLDTADVKTSNVLGMSVSTVKLQLEVKNESDEIIYGTITGLYVNDVRVDDYYLVGSDHSSIYPHEKREIYNVSSGSVWATTGVKNAYKLGLELKLENENDEVVHSSIYWLNLK